MEIKKKTLGLKLHIQYEASVQLHPTFVYKLNINNHKTVSNDKDMNNLFQLVLKVWWTWIKTFNIISFFYSLFHILMTKQTMTN